MDEYDGKQFVGIQTKLEIGSVGGKRSGAASPNDGQRRRRQGPHRSSPRQNIPKDAAARKLLTLVYYGLCDGHISALHRVRAA